MTPQLGQIGQVISEAAEVVDEPDSELPRVQVTAEVEGEELTFTTVPVEAIGHRDVPDNAPYLIELTCEDSADQFIETTGTECLHLNANFDRDGECVSATGDYRVGVEDGRHVHEGFEVSAIVQVED